MPHSHIILASIGTDGDVYPYLGLGATLVARGHRVTLLANEPYAAAAREHGLDFAALVTGEETQEFLAHPHVWHPLKSAVFLARWGTRFLERNYRLLAELTSDGQALLVASPGVVAARLVQEKLGRPLVSVVLQPGLVPSVHSPPVMPGVALPRWAPRAVGRLYWRGVDAVGDWLVGRSVNRLRATLGLPPMKRIFRWWLSPERVIGFFPDWYGPPQADWPPQIRLVGFPQFDGRAGAALSSETAALVAAGPPAVAITFGTGMMHAQRLFGAAIDACGTLGLRALVLTRHADQLPQPLPPHARQLSYEPFGQLFPRCAAVVHHGGIGTTARALAAGAPQLVVPFAYDQLDNAARVERLGCGVGLKGSRARAESIAQALAQLTGDGWRDRCREIAVRCVGEQPFAAAAAWIEEALRNASGAGKRAC